jgi:L-asparaginase/Glu-tRNA(Gln) amidotransferase subunit D
MVLHKEREHYDAFLIIHGTDTMAYTASALSLMLVRQYLPPAHMNLWKDLLVH